MSIADEIEGVIGHEALCVLVVHYGGQALNFSKKAEARLAELIGAEKAERLVFTFRSETIDVPTMRQARSAKNRATDTMTGLSANEIADRLGITARHARRIKQRA